MTINDKSERNYRGNCLGWAVTSYGGDNTGFSPKFSFMLFILVTRFRVQFFGNQFPRVGFSKS